MSATPQNKNEMPIFSLKGRYAYALFELTLEENALAERCGEIQSLLAMMKESPDLREMLKNPHFDEKSKLRALHALGLRVEFSSTMRSFIALVVKKGRAAALDSIAEAFLEIADIHNHIVPVDITSAHPLNENQQQRLQQLCVSHFGEGTEVRFLMDADLLGGVQLTLPGRTIDASLAGKFSQLQNNFKNNFQTT